MKKYNLKYIYLICAVMIFLPIILVGCKETHHKYVIGVSQCSEDIWRNKLNEELKTCEYFNDSISIRLASSNDDSKKQSEQINKFIDEGVDLLIVSPNQLSKLSPAINRAYKVGIPVIIYDRMVDSEQYTAFIGCDNYTIGYTMGQYIAQQLHGRGRIVEIKGLEGSSPALERHRGFIDAIKTTPNIQVVESATGDWKEKSGYRAMKSILANTEDFDFIFAHNDRMALGAYKAAQEKGVKRNYRYTGVDAMSTKQGGLELVRDGILSATYLYPTKGDEVIALAMKILTRKPFHRHNYLSTSLITKENATLTLMQAKDLERQQQNLKVLHGRVDQYLSEYNSQQLLLVALAVCLIVIVLASVMLFRAYIIKTRVNEQLALRNDEQEKFNEALTAKNSELERLNQEVMELTHSRLVFFTNISHELRTPLTLIVDPVEMLLEDEKINGRSRDLLLMVRRNAVSLQQLVSSILDFRKIQNGKMELDLCKFDILKALKMWTGDVKLTAERKQIQLHFDANSLSSDTFIVADKDKLARIVFNLLSNALKYTPSGGDIYVSVRDTVASDVPTDKAIAIENMLRIDVRDTGRGISKDEIENVFERFFQAKGAASGTGIGLALTKSFVDLHHGLIWVESEVGKGSDFVVLLPRIQDINGKIVSEDSSDTEYPSNDSLSEHTNGMLESALQYIDDGDKRSGKLQQIIVERTDKPTLLVIDDNNDIRQYERTLLQDDYFVLEASDGKEGLEIAKKEIPDLVICDVMMPIMDGLEFTEQLKTLTPTSHIPVIMLTAKNLEEHRAEGYEHGADSYITKPFHSNVLLARIENLLKQRQLLKHVYQTSPSAEKEIEESHLDDRDKLFIKQLQTIIQMNLGNSEFGVEDIGRQIGLSRVQLYRKVKAMTGSSVVDLLRKARLAKAHRLLQSRSMSVSEVAYEVGFSAPSYFTKCFKDEYGVLPGDINA